MRISETTKGGSQEDGATDLVPAIDALLLEREDELVGLLSDLISIDSQVPPFSNEVAVVLHLQLELEKRGLGTGEIIYDDPERPSLVLRIKGHSEGPNLMFNGHVDTKPVGAAVDLWDSDPIVPRVEDGRLYGLGSSDMKGAIAAMVIAMSVLHDLGVHLAGDVILCFVADEEAGAYFGSRFLAKRLANVDACLIGEPSGVVENWDGIPLVSRGVLAFRIVVRGTQMHSSLSQRMSSVNASLKAADLMIRIGQELRFDHRPHPLDGTGPTLNVGVLLSGGSGIGTYPGRAEFVCDLRTVPGMDRDRVASEIQDWLDACHREDPELQATFGFEPGLDWIPPSEISAEHPLVDATRQAAREVLGKDLPLIVFPGGTDAPWYQQEGIETIPSFGPGLLTVCHGPNEYVDLNEVHASARMYARIALNYCGKSSNLERAGDADN